MNWLNLNYQEYTSLLHSREAFVKTFTLGIDYLTSAVTKTTLSKSKRKETPIKYSLCRMELLTSVGLDMVVGIGISVTKIPYTISQLLNCNLYKTEVCRKQPTFIVYVTEQTFRSLLKIHTASTKTKRYTLFF